jgi:hypothetical protein
MKEAMMGNYAAHTIEWSSFGRTTPTQGDEGLSSNNDTTLPDGDQICIIEEDGARFEMSYQVGRRGVAPYELRVFLETGAKVTAWKELKAVTKEGETCSSVFTQGDQHVSRMMLLQVGEGKMWYSHARGVINNPYPLAMALVFSKAHADGVHIATYELHHLLEKGGKSITFRWERD